LEAEIERLKRNIEAEEAFDVERENLLGMLEQLAEVVLAAQQSLQAQMDNLGVTTDTADTLLGRVLAERLAATLHRQEMDEIASRAYIWTSPGTEDTLDEVWYRDYMGDTSHEALGRFFWQVDETGTVTLYLHYGDEPIGLTAETLSDFKASLLALATGYTEPIRVTETLEKLLSDGALSDSDNQLDNMANRLFTVAKPMLLVDDWVANNAAYTNVIVAAKVLKRRDGLYNRLQPWMPNPNSTRLLDATDAYTLALLQRVSMVPLNGVSSLREAQDYYRLNHDLSNNPNDRPPQRPVLTSVYEAEAEALRLEQQMVARLRTRKNLLHPLVVTALTESDRTRVFCMALASGEIDIEELPGDEGYEALFITRDGEERVFNIPSLLDDPKMHIFIKSLLTFVLDKQTFDDDFVQRTFDRYRNQAQDYAALWRDWTSEEGAWNDWMDAIDEDDTINARAVFDILKLSRLYALVYMPK
ncbi:MAG: hypothetical protein AAF787_20380, partial [Chloroflexota bacterium]